MTSHSSVAKKCMPIWPLIKILVLNNTNDNDNNDIKDDDFDDIYVDGQF